jgi:hypothetical protein
MAACGLARTSAAAGVIGPISACSCKSLREIGDRTAQFVGFHSKECVNHARAVSGKRNLDEGGRLDLLGILCAGWKIVEKILDVDFKHLREPHHERRAHTVFAFLIFLDLLERDAKSRAKLLLTYLRNHHQASCPKLFPKIYVERSS